MLWLSQPASEVGLFGMRRPGADQGNVLHLLPRPASAERLSSSPRNRKDARPPWRRFRKNWPATRRPLLASLTPAGGGFAHAAALQVNRDPGTEPLRLGHRHTCRRQMSPALRCRALTDWPQRGRAPCVPAGRAGGSRAARRSRTRTAQPDRRARHRACAAARRA